MYRCGVCGKTTEPGQPRLVHIVSRVKLELRTVGSKAATGKHDESTSGTERLCRQEIAKEVPVCPDCKDRLDRQAKEPAPTRRFGRAVSL
jgi:hypothetical protein